MLVLVVPVVSSLCHHAGHEVGAADVDFQPRLAVPGRVAAVARFAWQTRSVSVLSAVQRAAVVVTRAQRAACVPALPAARASEPATPGPVDVPPLAMPSRVLIVVTLRSDVK